MKFLIVFIVICLIYMIYFDSRPEIYFDNNATTYPHRAVVQKINSSWRLGNSSSSYSEEARAIVDTLKAQLLRQVGKPHHRCIITSGASESNNLLFRGYMNYVDRTVEGHDDTLAYRVPNIGQGGRRIIISNIEHKTSIECVESLGQDSLGLASFGLANFGQPMNIVAINDLLEGRVQLARGDLLSVMAMNNETGNILPIVEIGALARSAGAWFHSDIAQYFGKCADPTIYANVDCLSISFHKCYGPIGIGALIVPQDFPIGAQISGSQNDGLRGGTDNVPLCAGAISAMAITFDQRVKKNNHLYGLCQYFRTMLGRHRQVAVVDHSIRGEMAAYRHYSSGRSKVIFLSDNSPNTVLVSFINSAQNNVEIMPGTQRFCNIKFRQVCADRGIKVSIGSACNTSVAGPSHVLIAMKLPFIIRCGVIRFSFGDYNTYGDIDDFESRMGNLLD